MFVVKNLEHGYDLRLLIAGKIVLDESGENPKSEETKTQSLMIDVKRFHPEKVKKEYEKEH